MKLNFYRTSTERPLLFKTNPLLKNDGVGAENDDTMRPDYALTGRPAVFFRLIAVPLFRITARWGVEHGLSRLGTGGK